MAGGEDDRIIGRVVVDGIDVRPVAARARTDDVAEMRFRIELLEFLVGKRLPGELRINVEADGALVERLDGGIAVRIQNVPEAPLVDHGAVGVDLDDHVAHGADVPAVKALQVRRGNAQEIRATNLLISASCIRSKISLDMNFFQTLLTDFWEFTNQRAIIF